MNKKQKYVIVAAMALIAIALVVWIANGGEILSKDGVWIEQPLNDLDRALGQQPKLEFKKQFILGLIPHTAVFVGSVVFISAILFFVVKKKEPK
jgi:hypothetical protein